MSFYESIVDHYDHIFPFDDAQVEYVKTSIIPLSQHTTILDIGCGTGSLAISLGRGGFDVVGIDLDIAMIDKAAQKSHGLTNVSFRQMDLRDIAREFSPSSFDAILCFGNTLVHLPTQADVLSVFKACKILLKNHGKFLLQILNYDYVLAKRIPSLPTIENDVIRFERIYKYNDDGSITFATKLKIKPSGQIIENEVFLYPLLKVELETMLIDAGFHEIRFYGDFHRNPLKPESLPLIVEIS
jgi:glycine/sarcosine N-methyltransferase